MPELLRVALDRFGIPAAVAADRWREAELDQSLGQIEELCDVELTLRGQGFYHGGEDLRSFRQTILRGEVVPVESLLMRSAMAEARAVHDAAGNAKLSKASEGGRRLRAKDDAAAAAILAVAEGQRQAAAPDDAEWINVQ